MEGEVTMYAANCNGIRILSLKIGVQALPAHRLLSIGNILSVLWTSQLKHEAKSTAIHSSYKLSKGASYFYRLNKVKMGEVKGEKIRLGQYSQTSGIAISYH